MKPKAAYKAIFQSWLERKRGNFIIASILFVIGDKFLNPQIVKTLSQLCELEQDGLVKHTVFAEVPPHVEYELTPFGRSLEPILLSLRDWGERYRRRLP